MRKVSEFEINDLLPIGFGIIVAGIGIAYGLSVVGDIKADFYAEKTPSTGCNTTTQNFTTCQDVGAARDAVTGVAKIPEKLPLIVTVIVAAVIIGILVRYLMVRMG